MPRGYFFITIILLTLYTQVAWGGNTYQYKLVGVNGLIAKNITEYLGSTDDNTDYARYQIEQKADNSLPKIQNALKAFGYYKATIKHSLTAKDTNNNNTHWTALFDITLGKPVTLSTMHLSIPTEHLPFFVKPIKQYGFKPGDIFHSGQYEHLKKDLLNTALSNGFFDVKFTQSKVAIDWPTQTATIDMNLSLGSRYQLGDVQFDVGALNPDLFTRLLKFKPGTPYTAKHIAELHDALLNSQYFDNIHINAEPNAAINHIIPVTVIGTPRKKHQFSFGVGYATDTGARGSVRWDNRWLNQSGANWHGSLGLSLNNQHAELGYVQPIEHWLSDELDWSVAWSFEETDALESEITALKLSTKKQRWDHWHERLFISLQQNKDIDLESVDDNQTETTDLILLGGQWQTTKANSLTNTSRGHFLSLTVQGGSEWLGSDVSLLQAQVSAKWVHRLNKRTRLLLRSDFGSTLTDDFDRLPASLRFFAGGDTSVRGYDLDELGPEDDDGDVLGGQYLIVGSAELDYEFYPQWKVAAFFDIGNAINTLSDPLARGLGVGFRWESPIGAVRIDFAKALDQDEDFRLHLRFGPDL
ncbi:MAG: outer membrane protein assembly factor [Methylococcales bacterium]|jgi:translocation and assembly module TamA|nr:outer membrane protein assembly factor [Methylococcales bacterium]MBT7445544.1 outer membrane protein assembly factor [Methylococcales bacterium]